MPIKTLHLTSSWHPASGGIRTFYQELIRAANARERHIRLVVPGPRTETVEAGPFGRIHYIAAPRSWLFDSRYRLLLPHTYLSPFHQTLRRILRAEQPDLIEICDKYSLCWLAGLLRRGWMPELNRPALVGMSCERMDDNVAAWISRRPWLRNMTKRYLGQLYIGQFDCHIANSPYTADELCEAMTPAHQRPVLSGPMGADIAAFSPERRNAAAREALLARVSATPCTALLLYAGRLSAEKNLGLLVEMMERLSADNDRCYRLIIAGDGPARAWLQREMDRSVPGRVYFAGQIGDRAELADLYANCDAFIHPNPREPFGIAPLEAMASGLPLVAPESGGVLSYADQENAWLAPASGPAFAQAVRDVFGAADLRRRKTIEARRTAEAYSWDKIATGFFSLYDTLHLEFRPPRQETAISLPQMEARIER
ncbi:MAG: glycosyltransferase [Blastocatellia bacterium]